VVLAREDRPGEKRLIAYVVPRPGARLAAEELRAYLKQRLPEYMVPRAVVLLERLPMTQNGKIDRAALLSAEQHQPTAEDNVTSWTEAEMLLARIWAQVLGLEQVSIHDNFFDLGGDSILSMQLVTRARQAGLEVRPEQVFQHQTVAELAAVARSAAPRDGRESDTPLIRLDQEQMDMILAQIDGAPG
jgi:aryl carrier-like protein